MAIVDGSYDDLIESLAAAVVASKPALFGDPDEVTACATYLRAKCAEYITGRDGEMHQTVAIALIQKRERGIPWTDADEELADFYGVSGPRRMTELANGQVVPTRLLKAAHAR